MKTIALVAMTTAMWAALVLPVAPASASGAAEQCDPFGVAADFDCFNLETAVGRCEVHSVSEISRLGCIRLGRGGAGRGGGVR